jgi:hypothetical protein
MKITQYHFPNIVVLLLNEEEDYYLDYLHGNENEEIQDPDEVWQPQKVYM